jgi:hypothetical protein
MRSKLVSINPDGRVVGVGIALASGPSPPKKRRAKLAFDKLYARLIATSWKMLHPRF